MNVGKSLSTKQGDPYDLERFVVAQEPVYETVLSELRGGRKRSHWIWFVFPQLRGLGRSPTAQHFGISSRDEARAYLAHDVLGTRLTECARLVLAVDGRSANQIFGSPDDLKVRSSMTLFASSAESSGPFDAVLEKFYGGAPDPLTVDMLTPER